MRKSFRSAALCAALFILSAVILKFGSGGEALPSEDYSMTAKQVFYMYDEEVLPSAISPSSANAVLRELEADSEQSELTETEVNGEAYVSEVLPPVLTPPSSGAVEASGVK